MKLSRLLFVTFIFLLGCSSFILISAEVELKTDSDEESIYYIKWLEEQSMLYNAGRLAGKVSGTGSQWRHPFAVPQTEEAAATA